MNNDRGPADDPGQATVELALLLPAIALLLLAVVQVGVVARAAVLTAHAAREAARVAAVDPDPAAATRAAADAGGLDPRNLVVTVADRGGEGTRARVHVRYHLVTDMPLVGRLLPDIELDASASMRVEAGISATERAGTRTPDRQRRTSW